MDISAASLSALQGLTGTILPALSASRAAGTSAAIGVLSSVPLDPSTGLPLLTSGIQVEILAARALFAWNLQAIAAIRNEEALALAFSAVSAASVMAIEGLIRGASFEGAQRAAGSSASFSAGLGEGSGPLLNLLLDYFSPAASALRVVGYGLDQAGSASGEAARSAQRELLEPSIISSTQAAGAGAPGAILIALRRTEAYSLRALDLYVAGGSLPSLRSQGIPPGGYGSFALSALEMDYRSQTDFLGIYFGPGADGAIYSPIDIHA